MTSKDERHRSPSGHILDMFKARVATQHRLATNDPHADPAPDDPEEARRLEADLEYNRQKNSGELRQRQEDWYHLRELEQLRRDGSLR